MGRKMQDMPRRKGKYKKKEKFKKTGKYNMKFIRIQQALRERKKKNGLITAQRLKEGRNKYNKCI